MLHTNRRTLVYLETQNIHAKLEGEKKKKKKRHALGANYIHKKQTKNNTTLLPSVNTVALGMFCGAKYTHHTFTPVVKHH